VNVSGALPAAGRSGAARAAVAIIVWAASAAASARVGFWPGLGSVALLLGLLALATDRSLWREIHPVRWRAVVWGAAAGLLMALVARALYPLVVTRMPWVAGDGARLYLAFAALTPGQAALVLPLVIAGEELVWRGVVHGALADRFGSPAAVLAGASLYGAATLPSGSPVLAATALACGLAWGGLRTRTAGLVAPLVSHLVWAALVLFVRPPGRP
jgi:membrane protease YdiL (CAAX protease family)